MSELADLQKTSVSWGLHFGPVRQERRVATLTKEVSLNLLQAEPATYCYVKYKRQSSSAFWDQIPRRLQHGPINCDKKDPGP